MIVFQIARKISGYAEVALVDGQQGRRGRLTLRLISFENQLYQTSRQRHACHFNW